MDDLKEGDVVMLKSGGPVMTINKIHSSGEVTCQWFDAANLKDDLFKLHSLEKYEESDGDEYL